MLGCTPAELAAMSGPLTTTITILTPPDAGTVCALEGDTVSIGQHLDNRIVVADPSVGNFHATLRLQDGQWHLHSSSAMPETYVNGRRADPAGVILYPGDIIALGEARLSFGVTSSNQRVPIGAVPAGVATVAGTLQAVDAAPPYGAVSPKPSEAAIPADTSVAPGRQRSLDAATYVLATLPSGEHAIAPLAETVVTIGQGPDNGLVIADTTVSHHHATLELRDGWWHVFDAGSLNGTFVNDQRVGPNGYVILDDDTVHVGTSTIRLGYGSVPLRAPPPSSATTDTPPRSTSKPDQVPGRAIILGNRYLLQAKLGQGAIGTVYRAIRLDIGDEVAVRILRPDYAGDPAMIERLDRQVAAARRIRHPNVTRVLDFGRTPDGATYVVEELLRGRTLRQLLATETRLTSQRVVSVMSQLCAAVDAVHSGGILLRDLKPETIFVESTQDGGDAVKLADPGLVRLYPASGVAASNMARVYGTPPYISPEQWLNKPLDSRADVYALGVIFFELLTGRPPFDGLTPESVAEQHLKTPPPDVRAFGRPDLGDEVARVVRRALAKDVADRPESALELGAEIEDALAP